MSQLRQIGDLEIDQDLEFQHREWRLQRVLWTVGAILLVLTVLGLFGGGPISTTTNASDDGFVSVDYHRFVRHDGRASLNFDVDTSHAANQEVEIWLDQDFFDDVQFENVSPAPKSVQDDNGRMTYVFEIAEGSDTLNATFEYRPQHIGRISGDAGSGDSTVSIDQISYP